jgi:hypothetical protein
MAGYSIQQAVDKSAEIQRARGSTPDITRQLLLIQMELVASRGSKSLPPNVSSAMRELATRIPCDSLQYQPEIQACRDLQARY